MAEGFFGRRSQGKGEMAFVDHLEELRWHIIRSLVVILFFAVIIFINIQWVFDNVIAGPINPNFISYRVICRLSNALGLGNDLCLPPVNITMQTTTFGGQFFSSFSIAFVGGLIASFPYIFWEFWRFVKPALKQKELNGTRFVIFWVSFFFFLGSAFGYYVLGPFTFNFLASFQVSALNMVTTRPTINDYIDNLTDVIVGCGIAFEMPVLTYALTKIGIVTPQFLKRTRKYAIVILLVLAAVITPSPDWYSQTIVFLPLFALYELSVYISRKVYKGQLEKDAEEWS
ncbi:MAG: twin-arginine translocase subunit TatC [Parafilimonas sp.]